ncbi:hypothetical protein ccbrp13_30460 [Ktedonobacteria bacterium brp13]|nr:hypothetical protein ccbrp13_30460 [Ktedonobacteria bacterium brp13]
MIDPKAVILQVQQGDPPTTWKILKGRDFRFVQGVIGGLFLFVFLYLLIWQVSEKLFHVTIPFSYFPYLIPWFPYDIVLIAFLAALYGYKAWSKAARQKDSALVLMPDGLVQCTNYHDIEKHEYKVLFYPDIANIEFRRIDASKGNPTTNMYQIRVYYGVIITYQNNQEEQWMLDIRFGPPDDIAKTIVNEYKKYRLSQAS